MSELEKVIEQQLVNVFKVGMLDGLSQSKTKPDPLPVLREAKKNILRIVVRGSNAKV